MTGGAQGTVASTSVLISVKQRSSHEMETLYRSEGPPFFITTGIFEHVLNPPAKQAQQSSHVV